MARVKFLDEEQTYIEVFPSLGFSTGHKMHAEHSETAKRIVAAVKGAIADIERHVDTEYVYLHTSYLSQCEHCKGDWIEDGNEYNGGCCDEDEKNNPEDSP